MIHSERKTGDSFHIMTTYAIILAGGQGTRLGAQVPKQFLPLGERPVIRWSMDTFAAHPGIDGIVIVCPEEHISSLQGHLEEHPEPRVLAVIPGGETRQGSAWNALTCQVYHNDDILLFHDAARPFVTGEIIGRCIEEAKITGACGVYVPATDTITEIIEKKVLSIPPRERLYYTQTPQAFRYGIIRQAHEQARTGDSGAATDDVSLVMKAGYQVSVVEGTPENFKITTALDYELARWIAGNKHHG